MKIRSARGISILMIGWKYLARGSRHIGVNYYIGVIKIIYNKILISPLSGQIYSRGHENWNYVRNICKKITYYPEFNGKPKKVEPYLNWFHLIKIRFFAIFKSFRPFSTCNSYFHNAKYGNKCYSYPHNSVLNSTLWENSFFPVFCFIKISEIMHLQHLKCQFSK